MAYPAGIITRAVTFGPAFELEDGDTVGMNVTFKATRPGVLWSATGQPAVSRALMKTASDGIEQTLNLPVTNQDGWNDGDGNVIVPGPDGHVFLYLVTITYTQNGLAIPGTEPRSKVVAVPQGEGALDLDKLVSLTSPGGTVVQVPDIWSGLIDEAWAASAEAEAAALRAEAALAVPVELVRSTVTTDLDDPESDIGVLFTAKIDEGDVEATSGAIASIPSLYKSAALYNDLTAVDLWFLGIGSSVSLGPNGGLDAVNSISAYFHTKAGGFLNRLGNLSTEHYNGGVGGTTLTDGYTTGYAAAKAAAGGVTPKVVTIGFGMNDGMPAQYHSGQTFPFVYSRMLQLIDAVRADGGDPIVFTTPHPHTVRTPWTSAVGSPSYPSATPLPALTAGASVVMTPAPTSGNLVPSSYRHLKVNDAMRQAAHERGAVVIDVEPLWFDAVDKYGEDALFNTGQYNHPNLFAYQQSYHKGIDKFVRSLARPVIQASAPKATAGADAYPVGYVAPTKYRPNNAGAVTGTTLVSDSQLFYDFPTIAAATIWKIEGTVHYSTPGAADIKLGWLSSDVPTFPLGTSRWSVKGAGLGDIMTNGTTATSATSETPLAVTLTPNLNSGDFSARSALMTSTISVGGNGSDASVDFVAVVRVPAGGAKRLTLQYAQVNASGTTTVYELSHMTPRRIA